MCCNGSKKAVPQLLAVAITWSSYVELPVQRLFLGICADAGLKIYGGDATDTYARSPAPKIRYLQVNDAYAEWYNNKFKDKINKRMVLPVHHALQGLPESGKMWMKMIDKILISELGFCTTTPNRCIYIRERDGKLQLLLRQVDDFMLGTTNEKDNRDLFNDIGMKIQFPSEVEANIVPFEFLGVVKDCNGVNIIQTPDYIKMSSRSYIIRLFGSRGWDTPTTKQLPDENIPSSKIVLNIPAAAAASINKIQVKREDGLIVKPFVY